MQQNEISGWTDHEPQLWINQHCTVTEHWIMHHFQRYIFFEKRARQLCCAHRQCWRIVNLSKFPDVQYTVHSRWCTAELQNADKTFNILTIIYYYWWVKIQVQAMDIHTSNAKIEVLDTGPLVVLGHRSKIGSGKANFCFNRRLISWWELELAMPMPMSHARGVWGHAPSPTPLPRKILKFNSSKMAF